MAASRLSWWCNNLRLKCFIIGYMNMIACIVDITAHIVIVSIVTNGFQCDVDDEALTKVDWPWLEPLLLFINMGTHGFYPFPIILHSRSNVLMDYMPMNPRPRCYPGVFHVYLIDILNFLINVIWLKFVRSYVTALHKKNPEPMRMFLGISIVKLVLQIMYFSYQPDFRRVSSNEAYWFMKLADIILAAVFLLIIHEYIRELRREKVEIVDQPPSYVDCLMNGQVSLIPEQKDAKKETEVTIPEENKKEEPTDRIPTCV